MHTHTKKAGDLGKQIPKEHLTKTFLPTRMEINIKLIAEAQNSFVESSLIP